MKGRGNMHRFSETDYPENDTEQILSGHVYTDGSASDAVRNGGAGVYI